MRPARLQAGALYMVGSALAFSVMTLLVKAAGQRLPSQEIVLARGIVSLALSYVLVRRAGVDVFGTNRRVLLARGTLGFLALSCVYYAATHLPLADATVLQYLNPAFTALLAAAFLGERFGPRLGIATAGSLAGMLLVAKPPFLLGHAVGLRPDVAAVLAGVSGALFSAGAYVLVRVLSRTEHPLVIVFYLPLVTVPGTLPLVVGDFVWPTGFDWPLLLGVGLATQAGQVWLTRGLVAEHAGRAMALSYLQIVFAALWGACFFREIPDAWTLAGAVLVVGSSLVVALERRPIADAAVR